MRLKIHITGLVQGVGFRPFVYRLAEVLGLNGYVLNNMSGILIEAEGEKQKLDEFLIRLDKEKPVISTIYSLRHSFLKETGHNNFEIRNSEPAEGREISILPDLSLCRECAEEITDPKDRRFMYLFTNCTNCGPRYTIIEDLPYDRKNTSMKNFNMCSDCTEEYGLSSDRRFHAQPNACHVCGPHINLYDSKGNLLCSKYDALENALNYVRKGSIVAVKGIGGYHLICDAANEDAVSGLRTRKRREEKPVAVMFPDMDTIKRDAHINELEERAINSVERPVVIVKRKEDSSLAPSVSPGNSTVGVFLPYSPLHHIMLRKLKAPVVATSANMTDEPVAVDDKDAFKRLADIADYFLTHNRDIVRRCDDSVVRVTAGRQVPVRRSRGFAPVPVTIPFKLGKTVLALGPHMNNTIALGIGDKVYLSQHIGDLDTPLAMEFYEDTVNDLLRLFNIEPEVVVSDMHPGYYSTKYGEKNYMDRLVKVQHHFAHMMSCMAENDVPRDKEIIGFAFDGTGYGTDKTIWGGEVLTASYKGFRRAFNLHPFKLPGSEKCVKEPWRTALSLLNETYGENASVHSTMPEKEKAFIMGMLRKDLNSPVTTSMGRLFDGVASLLGLRHKVSYHAQAAIDLEQAALGSDETGEYTFVIKNDMIYYTPVIEQIMEDIKTGTPKEAVAAKFHNTIVEMIISAAGSLREETGIQDVALSGGVFQNSILTERAFDRLKEKGFNPLIHQLVPPNDGGISLGQAVFASGHAGP